MVSKIAFLLGDLMRAFLARETYDSPTPCPALFTLSPMLFTKPPAALPTPAMLFCTIWLIQFPCFAGAGGGAFFGTFFEVV
jgi:hypothetical protein